MIGLACSSCCWPGADRSRRARATRTDPAFRRPPLASGAPEARARRRPSARVRDRGGARGAARRARTTHREDWQKVLAALPALKGDPPPPPGPQERRAQNNVAHAIAGVSLAWAVEQRPDLLAAAKKWTLAAADYEPWGYTYNKPNVDLAAGTCSTRSAGPTTSSVTSSRRRSARASARSLERHAGLVHEYFTPGPKRAVRVHAEPRLHPDGGARRGRARPPRRVAGRGEVGRRRLRPPPPREPAPLPRRLLLRGHRVLDLLRAVAGALRGCLGARDGRERLGARAATGNWKLYVAHVLLPNGQDAFDFGDVWEGPLTRERRGEEIGRVYPGGTLQSNCNLLYRVAARLRDPEAQAVADRCRAFGHTSLEEHWTLLWRDAVARGRADGRLPLRHRFEDSGVVFFRTSWEKDALAFAFKAGPAGRTPRGPAARAGAGVAAEHGPLPSGRGQLHRVGGRPSRRGRHRLRGKAAGAPPQHDRGRRASARAWRRSTTPGRAWTAPPSTDPHRGGTLSRLLGADRRRHRRRLSSGRRACRRSAASSRSRRPAASACATASRRRSRGPSTWFLHADRPFTIDGTSFRDARAWRPGRTRDPARGRAPAHRAHDPHRPRPARLDRAGPAGPARLRARDRAAGGGRATEFDVTFGVKR